MLGRSEAQREAQEAAKEQRRKELKKTDDERRF